MQFFAPIRTDDKVRIYNETQKILAFLRVYNWLGLVSGTRTFYEQNKEEFRMLLTMLKELIV